MARAPVDRAGPWRFDELADLPDDGRRYEVVDGLLIVSPSPSHDHQLVGSRLLQQLAQQCPPEWDVCYEFALPLGTDGRVPDLAVVRAGAARGAGVYPAQPADFGLVVEIVSPSSRKTDRFFKPVEYAEAGIPLFWRVETDPDLSLHAFSLDGTTYGEAAVVTSGGDVPAPWGSVHVDLDLMRR